MAKTNAWLVEYAIAQVGRPYWFGASGEFATASLYSSLKKTYPSYYTASDFTSQYGQKVHDCSGLIKGALWCDDVNGTPTYKGSQDLSSSGMYSKASKKGTISTFDKVKGRLVFKGSSPSSIHHVGVYASGYVYEAKGHAYGVVKTKYNASDWNYWAQHPDFEEGGTSSSSSGTNSGNSGTSSGSSGTTSTNSGTSSSSSKLSVDGEIGNNTVSRWQVVMGQTGKNVDGKIDGQQAASQKYWTSITAKACSWSGGASALVKKWQQYLKDKGYSVGTVDGKLGQKTATASQQFLIDRKYSCGSKGADGYFGSNSAMALQNWLNAQ